MNQTTQNQPSNKKPKPWRTSMVSISPRKLNSQDPEIMEWVKKRQAIIKQAIAYQPKQARRDKRKRTQTGA